MYHTVMPSTKMFGSYGILKFLLNYYFTNLQPCLCLKSFKKAHVFFLAKLGDFCPSQP